MRYMIGTAVLLISPGLGKAFTIFFNIPISFALGIPDYIAMFIVLIFVIYDFRNIKNYYPYVVILVVLIVQHLVLICRYTDFRQTIGGQFAKNLF